MLWCAAGLAAQALPQPHHSPTTAALDGADSEVDTPPAPPVAWMATAITRAWEKGPRLATYGSPSVPEPPVTVSATGAPSVVAGETEASYSCGTGGGQS